MNRASWNSQSILAAILATCGVPGILVFGFYFALHACPVSRSKLGQIRDGMTTNQVAAILGQPSRISNGRYWYYHKFFCLQEIEVVFSQDGHLTNYHWE